MPSAAGLVVYDGDLFAFSHHGTDPAGGQLCNAFDLVRLHKFGIRDEDALPDTPAHKLPSYLEMQRWALTVDDVKIELGRTKKVEAAEDFSGDLEDEDAWRARLTYTDKGGIHWIGRSADDRPILFDSIGHSGNCKPQIKKTRGREVVT